MILYLDTSALVKLYVAEPGSTAVKDWVNAVEVVATSAVAYPEMRAAVARRQREGDLTPRDVSRIKTALLSDWEHLLIIAMTTTVTLLAGDVAEDYALRGMDAVHLASALWLERHQSDGITFGGWDARLTAAAQRAGLDVAASAL